MINKVSSIREDELTYILTYAGYILLSFELTKTMIVGPIKSFYANTEFQGGPFKTYKEDVLARHKNEFEACLLYLKDFMKAIDSNDLLTIQALRKHRNDLAHNLPDKLSLEEIRNGSTPLENVKNVIFKLSNYRTYMEVGQEPELRGVDWGLVKGEEYLLFEMVINKVRTLK
ncbi:hypothetical protein SAMN04488028_104133 [Reichenbachiella agariperforans]|uniref:Uncharacterized protein n=1 Tax=Reichenbachiella agariperforans TaxID=156994 RepID=A0A1M6RDW3_REIAG|nr:hypothetical protein [Reichenbachiella agariperforans]SHK30590.1 hypothetical protein SAMN04488028_104133 [Reichenbachiella agariperforans]